MEAGSVTWSKHAGWCIGCRFNGQAVGGACTGTGADIGVRLGFRRVMSVVYANHAKAV